MKFPRARLLSIETICLQFSRYSKYPRCQVLDCRKRELTSCCSAKMTEFHTFNNVSEKPSFPDEEEKVLKFWRENDCFKTACKLSKGKKVYRFFDGPPFATGTPHYGHILAGTIKDVVTRYAYQTGHDVERRFGWDCHGLPIEFEVDSLYKINGRKDVLELGIPKYLEYCRSKVMSHEAEWRVVVERLGRWIDFDNDYKTMYTSYMESVWWVFKTLYDKGLVYRGFRVMPFSTACNTPLSNFEANLNYKDTSDPSVIVSFPTLDNPKVAFLAWTTTPWTLPSNLALALNSELTYVQFKKDKQAEVEWIISKGRLQWVCEEMKIPVENVVIKREFSGAEMEGKKYSPLFNYLYESQDTLRETAFKVLCDGFVNEDSGTGVVHCAPLFGEDDHRVCLQAGIFTDGSLSPTVDEYGKLTALISDFAGMYVKDADKSIKQKLKKEGKLLTDKSIVHAYPYCWRSDTPLLYMAVPSWLVKVEAMRKRLMANNDLTRWVPSNVKEKRFKNWLADAKDWCISRNRFWGTPIPLWVSEDMQQIRCIGSVNELEVYAGHKITDLHRDSVDSIVIPDPRGSDYPPMKRVEQIFDCWFESGSMPYGQVHYPFENFVEFHDGFPADFVAEGLDQTRGWFYTLMILSTLVFDKPAFLNVVVNGLVLAEDGKKMSKRLKNYPAPTLVVDKHGADALRLYLVNSPVVRAESLRFKESGVKDVVKDVILPWYHAYRFFVQEATRYEKIHGKFACKCSEDEVLPSDVSVNIMDRWLVSITHSLIKFVRQEMEAYRLYTVIPRLLKFLEDLTNWYVRLNRDRMRGSSGEVEAKISLGNLYYVLLTISRLMAPYTPFICELFYQNLKNALPSSHALNKVSVHYLSLPEFDASRIDCQVEQKVERLQLVINLGRTMRDKRKVSTKSPLKSMEIVSEESFLNDMKSMEYYIKDQLNIVDLTFSNDFSQVEYEISPNFKVLGARLGAKMKSVHSAIAKLSQSEIFDFIEKKKIEVEGFLLEEDDLLVKRKQIDSSNPYVDIASENSVILLLDFQRDENLENMALSREIVNRIQRLRKELRLEYHDEKEMWAESQDNDLKFVMENYEEAINKALRRKLFSVHTLPPNLKTNEKYTLELRNGMNLIVYFTSKDIYLNEQSLKSLGDFDLIKNAILAKPIDEIESLMSTHQDGSLPLVLPAETIELKNGVHFALKASEAKWNLP